MSVHKPEAVWPLRALSYGASVRTLSEAVLQVSVIEPGSIHPRRFEITRSDARLLAKRLNACLDSTTTKGA